MQNTTDNSVQSHAMQQSHAQYKSIAAMVGAVNADYDRLEELQDEREALNDDITECDAAHKEAIEARGGDVDTWHGLASSRDALIVWDAEYSEELQTLKDQSNGCKDQEEAQEMIQEDPLSVEVRSGWSNAGDTLEAEEFSILLCTGGPAVRIRGELDQYRQPCRAWMEYQDWGTPWTMYYGAEQSVLLSYCQSFYFGE